METAVLPRAGTTDVDKPVLTGVTFILATELRLLLCPEAP